MMPPDATATEPGRDAPTLISVHSHKGGTGKTTLSVFLAALLAERKGDVCLIDCDVSAPGTHHLVRLENDARPGLLDFLLVTDPGGKVCRGDELPRGLSWRVHSGSGEMSFSRERPSRAGGGRLADGPARPGPEEPIPGEGGQVFVVPARRTRAPGAVTREEELLRQLSSVAMVEFWSGLLEARLRHLVERTDKIAKCRWVLLDTPPSVWGMSLAAERLVTQKRGAVLYVTLPNRQDFLPSLRMLDSPVRPVAESDRASQPNRWVVVNRVPRTGGLETRNWSDPQDVVDLLQEDDPGLEPTFAMRLVASHRFLRIWDEPQLAEAARLLGGMPRREQLEEAGFDGLVQALLPAGGI